MVAGGGGRGFADGSDQGSSGVTMPMDKMNVRQREVYGMVAFQISHLDEFYAPGHSATCARA